MMASLEALRDAFAAVPGVHTARVGMEAGITPADYPMVRIVPSKLDESLPRLGVRKTECLVYFGIAQHEFDGGLEELYRALFAMEEALLEAARAVPTIAVRHQETILDEDRVEAFKLMALRLWVEGA